MVLLVRNRVKDIGHWKKVSTRKRRRESPPV